MTSSPPCAARASAVLSTSANSPSPGARGVAKRALSVALTDAGIECVHLRGLGDPNEGREAARAGDYTRFEKVFGGHLKTETAPADLRTAMRLVGHPQQLMPTQYAGDMVPRHRLNIHDRSGSIT